jgi:hypothetical protein
MTHWCRSLFQLIGPEQHPRMPLTLVFNNPRRFGARTQGIKTPDFVDVGCDTSTRIAP